jgi:S-DNA-T family DNA segregation ATPase FtsK/SpoIIIE
MELDALEAHLKAEDNELFKVHEYATTPDATTRMVVSVEGALKKRQETMKARGLRKHVPTIDDPLVVVVLDELLPLAKMLKEGVDSPLGRIGYTGGAAGYVIWANSQVGQADSLGRFRDLVPQRICFATPNRHVTDAVLGDGAHSDGAECSSLKGTPGLGWSFEDGDGVLKKFRAAFATDDETRVIASGRAPDGMPLSVDGDETPVHSAYDGDGVLLWVGLEKPVAEPWWPGVKRVQTDWCLTRAKADEVRRKLIRQHHPVHGRDTSMSLQSLLARVKR